MALGVTPSQRQNSAFTGAALKYDTRQDDMAAFDALPPVLRAVVAECTTKLSAVSVLNAFLQLTSRGIGAEGATRRVLDRVAELERNELEVFAGRYQAVYRAPLPHTAAGASIARYSSPIQRRRNRDRTPLARTRGP